MHINIYIYIYINLVWLMFIYFKRLFPKIFYT
nr:CPPV154 hypothetical protein [Cooks petrelpox virus]